jgi:hypothetical protein
MLPMLRCRYREELKTGTTKEKRGVFTLLIGHGGLGSKEWSGFVIVTLLLRS